MDNTSNYPSRKHPRLKNYDYSSNGYYFVTVCSENMSYVFSSINRNAGCELASNDREYTDTVVSLSDVGLIAEQQLLDLESRFGFVKIDKYVIMPNHIHAIIILDGQTAGASRSAGASPRPTLMDIICAYKSLTTRICNKSQNRLGRKLFQTSFYEEIIRNEKAYQRIWEYIAENPRKWQNDEYYI